MDATLRIEPLSSGKRRIVLDAAPDAYVPDRTWDTAYPVDLISHIYAEKGIWLCDEIRRDEDPLYVEHNIRHEVLAYLAPADFAGKRVLDFGCGTGASTMVLGRLLPPCEIVGVELEERHLGIARGRAAHYGANVRFLRSPSSAALPEGLGQFDFIILSAVFEHLLPKERRSLLPLLWAHLKPGGVMVLNETPHRFWPLEMHTTHLPIINYLPDRLACWAARRFSRCIDAEMSWEELLRAGVRGGTVREILGILRRCGSPILLQPRDGSDRIDVWYRKLSSRYALLKKCTRTALKALKAGTGVEWTPWLAVAVRKQA